MTVAVQGPDSPLPARQKINDMLKGRRKVPEPVFWEIQARKKRQEIRQALEDAWEKHGAECMWHMKKEFAVDPSNCIFVARALQKGSSTAWKKSRYILELSK